MDKNFEKLFETVEEVKKNMEELEELKEERQELRKHIRIAYNGVVKKYNDAEEELNARIAQEEEENTKNKEEVVKLTKKQMQAKAKGEEFAEAELLEKLRIEVATHPLKVEAMEQLRNDIVVPAAAREKLNELRATETNTGRRIKTMGETVSNLLASIRGDLSLNCLASFEYIPGREEFMQLEFKELAEMRWE